MKAMVGRKIQFFGFALLVFFVPLIFSNLTFEAFEFPKMSLVYLLGGFLIALFWASYIFAPTRLKRPPWVVSLFVLSYVVSSLFSHASVWGYYGRFNDGLASILVFFGLYFVALNTFSKRELVDLLKFGILSFFLVSVYGICQSFSGIDRVYSSLGQPNWLAQYLSLFLPLVLYLYLFKKPAWLAWLGGASFFLGFWCLWLTFSLSGMLGFAISSVIFLALFARKFNGTHFLKLAGLLACSLLVVIFNLDLFGSKVHDTLLDSSELLGEGKAVRTSEDLHRVSDPGAIRLGVWKGATSLILSSPKVFFLGTGPETFPYVFQKYRPASLNYSSEWDYVVNKPHNYFLEVFAETGLFSLVFYLGILAHLFRSKEEIIFPSLGAFVVTSFFGWPVVATSLLFWGILAYVDAKD
jgi:hypothetical protein